MFVSTGNTCKKCGRTLSTAEATEAKPKEPVYGMSTIVRIEWDEPKEQHWLRPENIAHALSSFYFYCPNTRFRVTEMKEPQHPEEKKEVKLKRYDIALNGGCEVEFYVAGIILNINSVLARKSFRNGYFELSDGTKSKVPYLWKHKAAQTTAGCIGDIAKTDDWKSLYPIAVWLEE
jgi:hypothetical protein